MKKRKIRLTVRQLIKELRKHNKDEQVFFAYPEKLAGGDVLIDGKAIDAVMTAKDFGVDAGAVFLINENILATELEGLNAIVEDSEK